MATKKNILIVEENQIICELIYNAVKDLNRLKKILVSSNLQEAKSNLSNTNFDIVVLDLNLSSGDGLLLLKWITNKQLKTKIFIFSVDIELKSMCLKYGAHAFFDKANDFDALIGAIHSLTSLDDISLN